MPPAGEGKQRAPNTNSIADLRKRFEQDGSSLRGKEYAASQGPGHDKSRNGIPQVLADSQQDANRQNKTVASASAHSPMPIDIPRQPATVQGNHGSSVSPVDTTGKFLSASPASLRGLDDTSHKRNPPPVPHHSKPVANSKHSPKQEPVLRSDSAPSALNKHHGAAADLSSFPAPPKRVDTRGTHRTGPRKLSNEAGLLKERPPGPQRNRSHTIASSNLSQQHDTNISHTEPSTPSLIDDDAFTVNGTVHRPPPTRLVPPNKYIPKSRSTDSNLLSSDEDEEYETVEKSAQNRQQQLVDDVPDTTFAGRKPPDYSPPIDIAENKLHLTCVTAFATYAVVASVHHLHIYSLDAQKLHATVALSSETQKITALSYRCDDLGFDAGRYIWVGTREGGLYEVDVREGVLVHENTRAHKASILRIFRQKGAMMTIDQSLILNVWPCNADKSPPCIKQDPRYSQRLDGGDVAGAYCNMFNGVIWLVPEVLSKREPQSSPSDSNSVHSIRVYSPTNDTPFSYSKRESLSNGAFGDKLKNIGPATTGTTLAKKPGIVYLAHESGHVTLWAHQRDGTIECIDARRISTSRITAMQGVRSHLWAGFRSGLIQIYDVTEDPWRVIKVWQSHDMSVSEIRVLPAALWVHGRLPVLSVSIEGMIRVYDGLLAASFCAHQMTVRQTEWCSYRNVNIQICSWNCDSAKPEALVGLKANAAFPASALDAKNKPDIIVFSFQELIDLSSRSTTAKSFLLGRKKADGRMQEAVSHRYQLWRDKLIATVNTTFADKEKYSCVVSEILVGLFTCIFVKDTAGVKDVATALIKCGFAGMFGNKGAILSRLKIDDSTFCFINCHLAAGQRALAARARDLRDILETKQTLPVVSDNTFDAYVKGGDGTHIFDHESVFLSGDLNYRIDAPRQKVVDFVQANQWESLREQDQLNRLRKTVCNYGREFPLAPFNEAPITFAPTYKYDKGTNNYDTSEKNRVPSWCDRILWCTQDNDSVAVQTYKRYEIDASDHRPISASFKVRTKKADSQRHAQILAEVRKDWRRKEEQLIQESQDFYKSTF